MTPQANTEDERMYYTIPVTDTLWNHSARHYIVCDFPSISIFHFD